MCGAHTQTHPESERTHGRSFWEGKTKRLNRPASRGGKYTQDGIKRAHFNYFAGRITERDRPVAVIYEQKEEKLKDQRKHFHCEFYFKNQQTDICQKLYNAYGEIVGDLQIEQMG